VSWRSFVTRMVALLRVALRSRDQRVADTANRIADVLERAIHPDA